MNNIIGPSKSLLSNTKYSIYSVKNYSLANNDFIKKNINNFTNIDEICKELEEDNSYHFRIHKKTNYIFFGDIDGYDKGILNFINILINFVYENYNLELKKEDIKYTENNIKKNSYHYSIPMWNISCENLKEIHSKLLKDNKNEFVYKKDKKTISSIDTTIYSEHWFRCPYQTKGSNTEGIHIIKVGEMKDFIIDYIPNESINIDSIIEDKKDKKSNKEISEQIINYENAVSVIDYENTISEIDYENDKIVEYKKEDINDNQISEYNNTQIMLSTTLSQPQLYKKLFDECYKQERFETYPNWISIAMAIRNIFGDNEEAIKLFDYYSSKGINYEGYEKSKIKYKTFVKKDKGYTVATIYYYAIEDNKPKFIEIINKNSFELGQTDICKYIKILAGNKFLYKKENDIYKLYCFNGKYWVRDDVLLKKFIGNDLYNFLKLILIEVYWNSRDFNQLKAKIERLKYISMKRDIIETYKEDGCVDDINFDNKWWLLGFNNIVYDMKEEIFRDYHYDDYIATTTGYDWREPTEDELKKVNDLIKLIFPIEEERELYLQILATGLDGRCLEKFIIANGSGGNGKGLLNDLCLIALGNHAMLGNNSILFETSKTGSNPEKANLNKKRLVIFREPPEKNRIQNSIMKELTGGGMFSARSHYEKETQKELNLTMIIECNKRPLLSEEPQDAELRRIIDIYFRSSFTSNESLVDDNNNIYLANSVYKTKEWQENHKFALIKILINKHKNYMNNNNILKIPKSVADRTKNYLEMSMDIISWFKDNFELTKKETDVIKVKDIYNKFTSSHLYENMTKVEKKKYNKTFFINYIETNNFFKPYYCERTAFMRTFIKCWIFRNDEEDNNIDFLLD
jgi:phage/plasmid-associated DNA primase